MRASNGNAFMLFLLIYNITWGVLLSLLYVSLPVAAAFIASSWFIIVHEVVSFVVPLLLILRFTRQKPFDWFGNPQPFRHLSRAPQDFGLRRSMGRVNIILLTAMGLCLQPLMMLLSAVSALFFPNPVSDVMHTLSALSLPTALMIIALTPALCEEWVFRGYLLAHFRDENIHTAAFINGLFFAVIHLNLQQFLYAFVMGVLFVYFVYYTRSIAASMYVHFLSNGFQLVLSFWLSGAETGADTAAVMTETMPDTQALLQTVLFLLPVALIFTLTFMILFRTFVSHNRLRNAKQSFCEAFMTTAASPDEPTTPINGKPFGLMFWFVLAVYGAFMLLMHIPAV